MKKLNDMKNLFIVLGLILSASLLGQRTSINCRSEVIGIDGDWCITLMDFLYTDRVAPESFVQKTQENSVAFMDTDENGDGDWYVLTYEPELDYKPRNKNSDILRLKTNTLEGFRGERNVFVYKITGYNKYKRVTDTLYTAYSGQNDFMELFNFTIHKGGNLATSYVWRVDTDTWMLITTIHWKVEDGPVHMYNDIIFLKKDNEVDDTFTHTHFSAKGLMDDVDLPQLLISSHTKDDNVVVLTMKDGKKLKFTFLANGKIHYQGPIPLDKI